MYFLSVNRLRESAPPSEIGAVVGAHVRWSKQLIGNGTVLQAGRWGEAGGISIIKALDLSEADAIQRQDPLVSSGLATYELAQFLPDIALE